MDKINDENICLFKAWLEDLPNALNQFRKRLPSEVNEKLDFSIASLDIFEKYLLDTYKSLNDLKELPNASVIVDGYAIYIGETFRNVLREYQPNSWNLMLDKENVFYNLPIIEVQDHIECPLSLATACVDRRKGNYLSNILLYIKENM